ncbi:unnamed protein product, partial [Polarella glacialis]
VTKLVHAPPPSFFDAARPTPRFLLQQSGDGVRSATPRPNSTVPLISKETREAGTLAVASTTLPLISSSSSVSQLHFGDAVRLLLPALSTSLRPAALCTCVPPAICSGVGARAITGTDAVDEEHRLAAELAGSGRSAAGFVAVTAAVLADPSAEVSRRSVWEVYRANPLDAFRDDSVVHYGQHLRLGQRPVVVGADEVLLSCEPPSREGANGAPYLVLGRSADYGYPYVHGEGMKGFDATFLFAPVAGSDRKEGDPLDLRQRVRVIPASPYAHLAGPRQLQ